MINTIIINDLSKIHVLHYKLTHKGTAAWGYAPVTSSIESTPDKRAYLIPLSNNCPFCRPQLRGHR